MADRTETRKVLWGLRTAELCTAQDHDAEIERLEARLAAQRHLAAECRRRADKLKSAADELGDLDHAEKPEHWTTELQRATGGD
jgi:hypothetical protein